MPSLISGYKKIQVVNQLKSYIAIINNAIKMAEAKHGFTYEWEECSGTADEFCTENYFKNYLAPELQIVKTCIPTADACWTPPKSLNGRSGYLNNANSSRISAILSNGSSIFMWAGGSNETRHIQLWIDIDGPHKGKNMLGADVFGIVIAFGSETDYNKGVSIIGYTKNADRAAIVNDSKYGCSKELSTIYQGRFCGALIQYDGWKISDDYPVRF